MENAKEDIKRYDHYPNMSAVEKLCKHLRLAMQKEDAKWVAASDPEEMKRVAHWGEKYLGVNAAQAKQSCEAVAKEMHGDRHKNRVTFYYLLAKKLGKLESVPA